MELLSCHGGERREMEISEGSSLISAQTSGWQEAVELLQIPVIIFVTFAQMFHTAPPALWNGGRACGFFLSGWVGSIIVSFHDF